MTTLNQPGCIRVTLPLAHNNLSLLNSLHMGLALSDNVKKQGGRARCFRATHAIIVEMKNVNMAVVEEFIEALRNSTGAQTSKLNVIVEERESPEIDLDSDRILPGEFARTKLTKKLVKELPSGAIVVANPVHNGMPLITFQVSDDVSKADYWEAAVESVAAQKICNVYWDRRDVEGIHGLDLSGWDRNDGEDDPVSNPAGRE